MGECKRGTLGVQNVNANGRDGTAAKTYFAVSAHFSASQETTPQRPRIWRGSQTDRMHEPMPAALESSRAPVRTIGSLAPQSSVAFGAAMTTGGGPVDTGVPPGGAGAAVNVTM
jgi:hypothetical protein